MAVNYVKYEFESHEKLVRLRMNLPKDSDLKMLSSVSVTGTGTPGQDFPHRGESITLNTQDRVGSIAACAARIPRGEYEAGELPHIRSSEWRKQIEDEQENMQNHRFRVAVVGEFNRGKSTFLNALLGQQILPADILPATATINRIVYGAAPRAFLLYKDGTKEEVAVNELSGYITKRTEESTAYAAKVAEAVVEFPSIFCQNHVDLIDTPGMNDDDLMEDVTLAQLGNVDLAIMVVSATIPFSESEALFMERLLETEGICQIIVVITGMDRLYDDEDREKIINLLHSRIPELVKKQLEDDEYDGDDPIWNKYERIFSQLNIFGVSSTDALNGIANNDNALYQQSGFPELTKQLPSLILTSQNASTILRPLALVRRITHEYRAAVPALREQMKWQHQQMKESRIAFGEQVYAYVYDSAVGMADPLKEKLFNLIDGYVKLSDAACREYISCLASIKVLDAGVIGQALEAKTNELLLNYNDIRAASFEPELARTIGNGWNECCRNVIREIRDMVKNFDFLDEDRKARMEEILIKKQEGPFAAGRLKEVEFTWTHTPIATYAFMDKALIEYIHKCVKESFRDYQITRKEQATKIINEAIAAFADVLEQIVVEAFKLSNEQMDGDEDVLARLESADVMDRLSRLEEDTNELEREFEEAIG